MGLDSTERGSNVARFTEDPAVIEKIEDIGKLTTRVKQSSLFSSSIFTPSTPSKYNETNEYPLAHLVFQGGGTLGIAHLGFIKGLETAGIRIAGCAGTSAGAILAILCVAVRENIVEEVSETLANYLEDMPTASFIDGPYHSRRMIKTALRGEKVLSLDNVLPAYRIYERMLKTKGLNRGRNFENWLSSILAELNLKSLDDLDNRLQTIGQQLSSMEFPEDKHQELLYIAATAMPCGIKMVFPRDRYVLRDSHDQESPAIFARASMSIPLFFQPFTLRLDPSKWKGYLNENSHRNFLGENAREIAKMEEVSFLDGGLLSNLPMSAFADLALDSIKHGQKKYASIPTIGVSLKTDAAKTKNKKNSLSELVGHSVGVFDAIRRQADYDAFKTSEQIGTIAKSLNWKIGRTLIAFVDVGSHNWLKFTLSKDELSDLYLRGLSAAEDFLDERVCNKGLK